ncbi:MAG: DUF4384 domain-containing protein [Thiomargarita sp.]|nr:DUF4384 domain-containing protein [Thiomargarita sp.]
MLYSCTLLPNKTVDELGCAIPQGNQASISIGFDNKIKSIFTSGVSYKKIQQIVATEAQTFEILEYRICRMYQNKVITKSEYKAFITESFPRHKANNTTPKNNQPVNFKINYVYRPHNENKFKDFATGSILPSKSTYKIIFEPANNAYVYIFQIDSSNNIFRLFPTTDFENADSNNINAVITAKKYFIPAKNWSFKLDKTTGQETIYFIVSYQANINLENNYQSLLEQQQMLDIENRLTIREKWNKLIKLDGAKIRLLKNKTASESNITWEENLQQFTTNKNTYINNMCDGCVYIVNFEHR